MGPRVAFFLPGLGGGGAEKCMLTVAKGLADRGIDVNLVLSKAEGTFLRRAQESMDVVDLDTRSVWRSIPRLAQYLRQARPDVLISALDHANVAALAAKRLAGDQVRVVVSTHTIVSMAVHSKARFTSRAFPIVMRALYPTADGIVAVSSAVATDLSNITGLPAGSIRVIHVPVEIDEVLALSRASPGPAWLNSEAPPVIIAVGSLYPNKDHRTLVEAFAIARRRRPMRLIILGDGPERPRLLKLVSELGIENEVMMPGFAENPYSWMGKSAVFVLPSRWEGFGTVLVEAMACGVSPIATDCSGGPTEILDNGRYGILTPVGDAPTMADAIIRSLDAPFDSSQLRRRAEEFSAEDTVERYLRLIEELGT